jgi:hypothetical protein
MNVMLGRRAEAYTNLTFLLDGYILPNTFYHEVWLYFICTANLQGENGACGETPPAASSAVQDWMLMAWGGVVHVFAGVF